MSSTIQKFVSNFTSAILSPETTWTENRICFDDSCYGSVDPLTNTLQAANSMRFHCRQKYFSQDIYRLEFTHGERQGSHETTHTASVKIEQLLQPDHDPIDPALLKFITCVDNEGYLGSKLPQKIEQCAMQIFGGNCISVIAEPTHTVQIANPHRYDIYQTHFTPKTSN